MRCVRGVGRGVGPAATTLLLVVAVLLGAALVLPRLLGYSSYVITGGSMTGTYDRGSLVFARTVPVGALRVGDVITYTPPPDSGVHGRVTHRIVSIRQTRTGRLFRTKGDANTSADPWRFTLPARRQARVVFGVPCVGYVSALLSLRAARMLVVGLPAALIAILSLVDLTRAVRTPRPAEAQR